MLFWLEFIAAFFLLIYAYLIIKFYFGWKNISPEIEKNANSQISISLIVCCKNEATRLPTLIEALRAQTLSDFELIWINDHSTDATAEMLTASVPFFKHARLIHAAGFGKKAAQREGIISSEAELIITTDADCVPGPDWIETIKSFYCSTSADLIIAPVKFKDSKTSFGMLQQLEFMSLVASGMGAAGAGMPVFCNAANMAFKREMWIACAGDLHVEEMSGDDVFLLHAIKKRRGRVEVLKNEDAMILTAGQPDLQSFLKQRKRWLSKTSSYTDRDIIITGMIVAGINFLILNLFAISLFNPALWVLFLFVFGAKFLIDFFFLRSVSDFFKVPVSFSITLLLAVLYPFYVLISGLSSLLSKNKNW